MFLRVVSSNVFQNASQDLYQLHACICVLSLYLSQDGVAFICLFTRPLCLFTLPSCDVYSLGFPMYLCVQMYVCIHSKVCVNVGVSSRASLSLCGCECGRMRVYL